MSSDKSALDAGGGNITTPISDSMIKSDGSLGASNSGGASVKIVAILPIGMSPDLELIDIQANNVQKGGGRQAPLVGLG